MCDVTFAVGYMLADMYNVQCLDYMQWSNHICSVTYVKHVCSDM